MLFWKLIQGNVSGFSGGVGS